ncbi:uncharacterized protein LOC110901382 [Helianthus annuus]|uniref:uncharacterized protein LOC110901382 n=1 Tax=Helianthus annuus TaxID=4232 RepID=UPI000B8FC895|nr:uncharacterized protein LOC110901382 [Helianthus annuus]
MANIAKIEFPALNITGENYMPWTAHVKRHLKSMGVLETITEGNKCSDQDKVLWEDLKSRFDHQREVLLPTARDEWNNLRFQDFKKVNKYTSALFRTCSTLRFCGQTVTEEDMLEKTFSTFHASNINLQQQYRLQRFQRYYDLNSFLLVAEKNNEQLMKNHQARPTGSLAFLEANAFINDDTKDSGRKWGRGRGRGHFGKGNGRNHSFKGNNNFRAISVSHIIKTPATKERLAAFRRLDPAKRSFKTKTQDSQEKFTEIEDYVGNVEGLEGKYSDLQQVSVLKDHKIASLEKDLNDAKT